MPLPKLPLTKLLPTSLALLAALVLAVATTAPAHARKFTVVTTFTVIKDMVANVAGDAATVVSITKPGAEIHDYQPTPRDIVKAQRADLVMWHGLNLERWFERFFANLRGVPRVIVSANITPLSINAGPYDGKPNPHAWMSPKNALVYIENIRAGLVKHNPENAATYNRNAARYSAEIKAIDASLRARLNALPPAKRWLVTSEGAFSYLARDFGLRELFLWPINADATGTPQQIRKVVDTIRNEKITVVFSESTVSPKPMRQVAKETGARYGGVLYVDSLSAASGPVPTYVDLLRVTVETIVKGLER
ncbi:MAG: metal ABC transporter substrate-binding protein [Pseudomonadota bacterium]